MSLIFLFRGLPGCRQFCRKIIQTVWDGEPATQSITIWQPESRPSQESLTAPWNGVFTNGSRQILHSIPLKVKEKKNVSSNLKVCLFYMMFYKCKHCTLCWQEKVGQTYFKHLCILLRHTQPTNTERALKSLTEGGEILGCSNLFHSAV